MLCKKCEHRVVMPAFSDGICDVCGKPIVSPNTPADNICAECAEELNLCQHCGEPLEDAAPKIKKFSSPEEARMAGFNECLSLVYRACGLREKFAPKNPDSFKDRREILSEIAKDFTQTYDDGFCDGLDELADEFGIKWNSHQKRKEVSESAGEDEFDDDITSLLFEAILDNFDDNNGGIIETERLHASYDTIESFCEMVGIEFEGIAAPYFTGDAERFRKLSRDEKISVLLKDVAYEIGCLTKLYAIQNHLDMKEQETQENIFALIDYNAPGNSKPVFFFKSAMHTKEDIEDIIAGLSTVLERECENPENVKLSGDMVVSFLVDCCGCKKADPADWEKQIMVLTDEEYDRKYVVSIDDACGPRTSRMFYGKFDYLIEEHRDTPFFKALLAYFNDPNFDPKKWNPMKDILAEYLKAHP